MYLRIATVCNTLADTCTARIRDEASIIHEQCIVSISNVYIKCIVSVKPTAKGQLQLAGWNPIQIYDCPSPKLAELLFK